MAEQKYWGDQGTRPPLGVEHSCNSSQVAMSEDTLVDAWEYLCHDCSLSRETAKLLHFGVSTTSPAKDILDRLLQDLHVRIPAGEGLKVILDIFFTEYSSDGYGHIAYDSMQKKTGKKTATTQQKKPRRRCKYGLY